MADTEYAERRGAVDERIEQLEHNQSDLARRLNNVEKFKEQAKGGMLILALIAGTGIVGVFAELVGIV
jgi:hypothetical protein